MLSVQFYAYLHIMTQLYSCKVLKGLAKEGRILDEITRQSLMSLDEEWLEIKRGWRKVEFTGDITSCIVQYQFRNTR